MDSDDDPELCVLCGKELLHHDAVTVTRGVDTLINSSIRRNDDIAEKLQGLSSICVHQTCRKNYTRVSSIASVLTPSPKKCKTLRSSLSSFDFKGMLHWRKYTTFTLLCINSIIYLEAICP